MRDLIGPISESTQKSKAFGSNAADAVAPPETTLTKGTSSAVASPIAQRLVHEPDLPPGRAPAAFGVRRFQRRLRIPSTSLREDRQSPSYSTGLLIRALGRSPSRSDTTTAMHSLRVINRHRVPTCCWMVTPVTSTRRCRY